MWSGALWPRKSLLDQKKKDSSSGFSFIFYYVSRLLSTVRTLKYISHIKTSGKPVSHIKLKRYSIIVVAKGWKRIILQSHFLSGPNPGSSGLHHKIPFPPSHPPKKTHLVFLPAYTANISNNLGEEIIPSLLLLWGPSQADTHRQTRSGFQMTGSLSPCHFILVHFNELSHLSRHIPAHQR